MKYRGLDRLGAVPACSVLKKIKNNWLVKCLTGIEFQGVFLTFKDQGGPIKMKVSE